MSHSRREFFRLAAVVAVPPVLHLIGTEDAQRITPLNGGIEEIRFSGPTRWFGNFTPPAADDLRVDFEFYAGDRW